MELVASIRLLDLEAKLTFELMELLNCQLCTAGSGCTQAACTYTDTATQTNLDDCSAKSGGVGYEKWERVACSTLPNAVLLYDGSAANYSAQVATILALLASVFTLL